jgi:hypothetical protein
MNWPSDLAHHKEERNRKKQDVRIDFSLKFKEISTEPQRSPPSLTLLNIGMKN